MSRRIVGYEGEGKRRRPKYSEPLAIELPVNPPGPIERRLATEQERGGFTSRVPLGGLVRVPRAPRQPTEPALAKPAPVPHADVRLAMGSREHLQQSRLRGTARHVEVIVARRPPPIRLGDPPVTALEEPVSEPVPEPVAATEIEGSTEPSASGRVIGLAALRDAAAEALEAEQAHEAAYERREAAARALEVCWLALTGRQLPTADDVRGILRERVVVDEPALAEELADARVDAALDAAVRDDRLGDDAPEVVTRAPDPISKPAAALAAFARDRAEQAAGGGSGVSADRPPDADPGGRPPARRQLQGDRRGGRRQPTERPPGARGDRPQGPAADRADREAAGRLRAVQGRLSR